MYWRIQGGAPQKSKMALFGPQETDKFPATRPLKKMSEIFFEGIPKKGQPYFHLRCRRLDPQVPPCHAHRLKMDSPNADFLSPAA